MKKAALDRRAQQLHEIEEREQACRENYQGLKKALRDVADGVGRGRVPLHVIEGDTTLAIKVNQLRTRTLSPTPKS